MADVKGQSYSFLPNDRLGFGFYSGFGIEGTAIERMKPFKEQLSRHDQFRP